MAKYLSTFAIAEMLQVDPGSVANWIDQDRLKAYRTPGRHRRVAVEDLLRFLRKQKMPVPPQLDQTPIRVMVVDDEPAIAQLVARSIRQFYPDFEVMEAYDGFQAGTLLATAHPDLILLDLRMPGLDGYEICQRIKSDEGTKDVEVLAMTACPSPENEARILECGARACLSKPLDMERLMSEIERCL